MVATILVAGACLVLALTWVLYPLWLRVKGGGAPRKLGGAPRADWPSVTLVVVVRNAEASLRQTLQNLLALAYPTDRRRILVVSDASGDFTDAVARLFADKGVELLRTTWPRGAGTALNLARRHVRSDLVAVVDPEARLGPAALASLVSPFSDPSVGVVYGREVSAETGLDRRRDTAYWSYETRLRDLETRVFGTVSARGSLYAARTPLFRAPVPAWLNPDFATTLTAREHGYRAVYQEDAVCVLPPFPSVGRAYDRTVQAVSRDIATLLHKRHLLNPWRAGSFAWMLLFHKFGHWLTPWAALAGLAGLVLLAPGATWALVALALLAAVAIGVALAARMPDRRSARRAPWRVVTSAVAFAHGAVRAITEPPRFGSSPFPPGPRPELSASFAEP